MTRYSLATALLLPLGFVLGACSTTADSTEAGVRLTVTRDPALVLDAVRVTAFDGDREVVAETREASEGTLAESETVPLVFDGAPDGAEVRIEVDGLSDGDVLATAEASVTLARGAFVDAEVHLGEESGGGGDGGGVEPDAGGGTDAGGDAGPTDCDEGDTRECGATDVGECELGTETCTDGAWGACEGEVQATDEECPADGKDQDCSGTNDDGDNACGGVCTLASEPQDWCDATDAVGGDADDCEDDRHVCNGRNATTCVDHVPGSVEWMTSAGDVDWDQLFGVDLAGNALFATGLVSDDASGDTTIGGEVLETYGSGWSILVARFDTDDGAIDWVASAGGTNGGQGSDVAATSDGSAVYVTGQYTGSPAEFGTLMATDADTTGNTYFLAKYEGTDGDGDGQADALWVVDAGGTGDDTGRAVAVGPDGSVYVTGTLDNDIGADTTFAGAVGVSKVLARPCNGTEQFFVAKYSSAGEVLWVAGSAADAAETTYLARGRGIDVDADGNVYVTGTFAGSFVAFCDADTAPGCPSTCVDTVTSQHWDSGGIWYYPDAFVAKYDTNGNLEWVTRAGNTGTTSAEFEEGLEVASDGTNVYVLGTYDADIAFCENPTTACPSGQTLTDSGELDQAFLASYGASAGVFQWARAVGVTSSSMVPVGLALGVDGSIYASGAFATNATPAQFGLPAEDCYSPLVSDGTNADGFLARYEPNGDLRWARRMGGAQWDEAHGVTVADDGTAFVAGHFNGTGVPFCHVASGCTVTADSAGMPDGFVARFAR